MSLTLTFPFTVSDAINALPLGMSSVITKLSGSTAIRRFVALKDLDKTTGDAVTWRRGCGSVNGKYALLIASTLCSDVPEGNVIFCDDPHRAFFTLMRLVYGDDYEPYDIRVFGHNVSMGEHCSIGGAGFGHVPEMGVALKEGERRWRVPHIGRVVIEDDVDIGDNTTINRGCLGDTIIRRGAKIDSHVFIAHNADIGEDAVLVAGAIICGSAKIGKGAWIAAGACIRNGVTVGEGATVGLMANVVKDVAPHTTVRGNPARVYE